MMWPLVVAALNHQPLSETLQSLQLATVELYGRTDTHTHAAFDRSADNIPQEMAAHLS